MNNPRCKICSTVTSHIFDGNVLGKYKVGYYRCQNCDFIQNEEPYWLDEAYKNAITDLDIGLISRNMMYSDQVYKVIISNFDYKSRFLDYAGGYGMFTRMMRDKGLDFYHEDKFCANIYAENFTLSDLPNKTKFELITAFEVFEHFSDPIAEIKKLLKFSNTVIFSTELHPSSQLKSTNDWWYFTPETGQHLSFYSIRSLEIIADKFGLYFYSHKNLHMLTKRSFHINPLTNFKNNIQFSNSLLQQDYEYIKKVLKINGQVLDTRIHIKQSNSENDLSLTKSLVKVDLLQNEVRDLKTDLEKVRYDLNIAKNDLDTIQNTKIWRAAEKLRKLINPIRKIFEIKHIEARIINTNSKKILYIGHSYHGKTKSTQFLIEYLKENFDVEEILDESWMGKPFPNLEFVDESYLSVIFFQNLPSPEIVNNLRCKNIIFFPMYDGSWGHDKSYWQKYKSLKIMNFSSSLHEKLVRFGMNSKYIQYFPKPSKFSAGKKNSIFFWQRLTHININTLEQILPDNNKFKIHLHKAIDPEQKLVLPTKTQAKKYDVSYSRWYSTRAKLQDKIKESSIYIAPREYEGIGLSYLEAMAMGKAVVAVDNPTMNEYIKDNVTGYLFDLHNPREINLDNWKAVQKNTYEYMKDGYEKWLENKKQIIEHIYEEL